MEKEKKEFDAKPAKEKAAQEKKLKATYVKIVESKQLNIEKL